LQLLARHQQEADLDIRSSGDLIAALEAVVAAMDVFDFPPGDTFAVRLALEEALINAHKHGHGQDPTKVVRLRYRVAAEEVLAEVEDEGAGFDHRQVADPRLPANWDRSCGRGLLLMRHFLTSVEHNERGNCVFLRKARSVKANGARPGTGS
jgi:serine/threonine-protein kinase RsbW